MAYQEHQRALMANCFAVYAKKVIRHGMTSHGAFLVSAQWALKNN
jgi:hypothetical protein